MTIGGRKMTCQKWTRYRLLTEPRFNFMGRLACEWITDMFSRPEDERLGYIKQGRQGQSSVVEFGDNEQDQLQKFTNSLPASFIGSDSWIRNHTADALACAKDFGHPTVFITMTTNPRWREIRAKLEECPGLTAYDIPQVVNRAFNLRLRALKRWISRNMGNIIYRIQVIEYQKRGLPHAHILIKCGPDIPFSLLSQLISAELPDEMLYPELYSKVNNYMQHNKSHLNIDSNGHYQRCNPRGNGCTYNFPHPIRQTNELDENGRVLWRRRKIEDAWTNPHIPALLLLLDCHIMVDYCTIANVIFYLFKYLFKPQETGTYAIDRNEQIGGNLAEDEDPNVVRNEIKDYETGKWISASEAVWRILNFNTTEQSPAVACVDIHLGLR
jgi:Helitron helicase-like domain at N-terminus